MNKTNRIKTVMKNLTCGMEIDLSATAEEESDVNLAELLADKAGQETAPMTGLTSATTPLDAFFQACFLGLPALLLFLSALVLSTAIAATAVIAAAATKLAESRDDDDED
jgi:hypothetical protein